MRIIKAILNQSMDLIFGFAALGLLILHFIHLNNLNEMIKSLADEFVKYAWTGYFLNAWDMLKEIHDKINEWQEAAFLLLVVGYVTFNIINKVQMNLKKDAK